MGHLAYNYKIPPRKTTQDGKTLFDSIHCIVWTDEAYAFCRGTHLTVKDVASVSDFLDVELPSKLNQVFFLLKAMRHSLSCALTTMDPWPSCACRWH